MPRHASRHRQRAAVTTAVVLAATFPPAPGLTGPAAAKPPPRPGRVTGLELSATKPAEIYRVHATWKAATAATRYQVTLATNSGVVLDEGSVTGTSFTGGADLAVGSTVAVTVVPYNATRRGQPTTAAMVLPDVTPPEATYELNPRSSSTGDVTIELTSVRDDLSPAAGIAQTVAWGDGSTTGPLTALSTSFAHGYGPAKAVYYPVVTVTDQAGNASTHQLTAVVADTTPPTGTFAVSPTAAWASWTRVRLSQVAIQDDLSAADKLTRLISWGDGTRRLWSSGGTARHTYVKSGTFTPTVTLADEAGNVSAPISAGPVTVTVDDVPPRLRLTLPTVRTTSVRSWTTLRGRATDAQTRVREVRVEVIEKRGPRWFAYRGPARSWVRSGRTAASAWRAAIPVRTTTPASHRWSTRVRGLTRGLLVYRVSAYDHVGNRTHWRVHQQRLTRR